MATDNTPSSEWTQQYGLNLSPFSRAINERYFFTGAKRQQVVDTLKHLLLFGDMLLLVDGPEGSGKTRLVKQMMQQGESGVRLVAVRANPEDDAGQWLAQIAKGFELENAAMLTTLDDIRRGLRPLLTGQNIPVLVVDDAHLLSESMLRDLVNEFVQYGRRKQSFQLLLLSQHDLSDQVIGIVSFKEQGQWFHRFELEPLRADDVEDYLAERFKLAGWDAEKALPRSLMKQVGRSKPLYPGEIHKAVRVAAPGGQGLARLPIKSLAVSATIVGLLLASYLFISAQYEADSLPTGHTSVAIPVTPKPAQLPDPVPSRYAVIDEPEVSLDDVVADLTTQQPTSPLQDVTDTPPDSEASAEEAEPVEPVTENAGGAASESAEFEVAEDASDVPALPQGSPAIEVETEPETPAPDGSVDTVQTSAAEAVSPAVAAEDTAVTDIGTAATAPTAVPSPPSRPATPLRQDDWLLGLPPQSYTLQLLGTHQREVAEQFVRSHQARGRITYFTTQYRDQDWFAVIYGNYPTRDAAQAAITGLPSALRDQNPWARSLLSVQNELRTYPQ